MPGAEMIDLIRFVHVLGATILFGTGLGIAFFMVMANRIGDPARIAHVARTVVIADTIFTAIAVILQPITGALLAREIGWPLSEGWIALSLILYVVTGLFWLPVVAIQIRLRNLAGQAAADQKPLPQAYIRLYRIWFACGFPAFFAVLAIFWLMLARPAITLF
jgi:uncharacterized membrane protein